jgi:hypothetical protein
MSKFSTPLVSTLTLAMLALTACGGGGSNPIAEALITEAEAKTFAKFEIAMAALSNKHAQNITVLGQSLRAVAVSPDATVTLPCVTGSASAVVTKTGVHTGLAVGDQVAISYRGCSLNQTGGTWSGDAKLKLKSTLTAAVSATDYAVNFNSELNTLLNNQSSVVTKYNGQADVNMRLDNQSSTVESTLTIPAGAELKVGEALPTNPLLSVRYKANTAIASKKNTSANNLSLKVDGAIDFSTLGFDSQSAGLSLTLSTPATLSGAATSLFLSPTSGLISMTITPPPSEGSAFVFSISPNNGKALVKVDIDNNGSPDLTFNANWPELNSL